MIRRLLLQGYTALLQQLSLPQAFVLPAFELNSSTDGKGRAMAAAWSECQQAWKSDFKMDEDAASCIGMVLPRVVACCRCLA